MTDTQHTPGPWEWVNPEDDTPWISPGNASLRTVKHYGEDKTEIRDGKRYTSFSLPKFIIDHQHLENEANARLIAAAPELLDALEGLLKGVYGDGYALPAGAPATQYARAVIAKAKGEQDE